jgi:diguanylate cyclase (GGDEF)-like protein
MRVFSPPERQNWFGLLAFWSIVLIIVMHAALLLGQVHSQSKSILLTQAIQVHNLEAGLASHARVHLVGTVTYYDPLDYVMFIEDASGGVFIETSHPYPVHNGDLVEINGGAHASYRTEVALNPSIRRLGLGEKLVARQYGYADLATGSEDSQLVVIRGKVRAADIEQHENASYVHLDVGMSGGEVELYLGSSTGFNPESAFGKYIEATAVAGGVFDAKSQLTGIVLYAPNASAIRSLRSPKVTEGQLPLTEIDKVFESQRIDDTSRRLRVRGAVTYYRKGDSAVLESNGKSIYVQTRETQDLTIGDIVDAYGLPSNREYAPSLRQASLVKTGGRDQVEPRVVSYSDALSGIYSDNLISLSGTLVSQLHDIGADTLVMNVEGHLVNGSLVGKMQLPSFPLGSQIRIAGICRVVPGGPWRAPFLFHLEMRSAADAQLLSKPSWWTVRHLLELLGALSVLALAIAIWAILLRRRVRQQTERINRSMSLSRERSKILEKISSNQDLDVLLTEICQSIMVLLPGFICSYDLDHEAKSSRSEERQPSNAASHAYFEMMLVGDTRGAIGEIVVSGPRGLMIGEDQQEIYDMLAELATLAVERSLLHQQLIFHSTHDPLTALPNRRFCENRLQFVLEEAARHQSYLAIIYIDVDEFKHVNDRYGHKTGDHYLQQISARLQAQMRAADTLARIGGDEFLVIAPISAHGNAASILLSRLQACFDEPFLMEEKRVDGSASFGLAIYPDDGLTAEELKRNADQAMYLSKRKTITAQIPSRAVDIAGLQYPLQEIET